MQLKTSSNLDFSNIPLRYDQEADLTCDAYLLSTSGVHRGKIIELDLLENHQVMIGRKQFADDRLLHIPDKNISRRHCLVQLNQGNFIVQDLDSTNGTWLNGRTIEREILKDGDEIQLGVCAFVFRRVKR